MVAGGCTAGPDWNAATQQALADGRASLAAVAPPPPAPREPERIRPLRTAGLLPAPGVATTPPPAQPAAGDPPSVEPGTAPSSLPSSTVGLTGNGPDQMLALLGEPALRRAEGPVSIWLYSAAGCQLDVLFYPGTQGPRVAHVQARAGGFAQRTEAACLRDLAAGARRRPPEPRQGHRATQDPVG